MSALNGKWKLVSSDSFTDFAQKVGLKEEGQKKIAALEQTGDNGAGLDINIDGSSITLKIMHNGEEWRCASMTLDKLGKEIDAKAINGNPVKTTVTLDGGKLVRVDKGPSHSITFTREASGNELVETISGAGQTCKRKYVKA